MLYVPQFYGARVGGEIDIIAVVNVPNGSHSGVAVFGGGGDSADWQLLNKRHIRAREFYNQIQSPTRR